MDELSRILERATALIDAGYIELRIDGGPSVLRERVYCYELYHRVRMEWDGYPFTLNGELDKRGHPILKGMGLEQIPDFLVHQPGDMGGNSTIIEVKHGEGSTAGFAKDLETLSGFRRRAGYRRAILLVYATSGHPRLLDTIEALYPLMNEPAKVEVWFHEVAGEAALCVRDLVPGGARRPFGSVRTEPNPRRSPP